MKEIKKHQNMRTLAIALFSVVFIFSCISCTSISPKYLAQTAAAHSVSKVELKETYIFDNYPQKILGHNHSSQEKSPAYNEYCLWNYIEPNYYKKDSLHYLYKTSLELTQKNKIHFKLIDTLGNVVRERTRKVEPQRQNFVSFRNTDFEIYVLVNRFFTETICFALDKHGDLVVPSESTAAGFLILFPLAGALNHDAYIYRRVDTVAN
ncbi:hypothetical protein K7A41_17830 [Sphingobacterium sp. InxBP1]|uniref:hypothetical protein n=1 Tax=Sphingobacterium sp. InxBP1 TaxID=2870328 RepID=UPI0022431FF9|nr:hypothetical protein [Sphingobacterium sp. InxBP1]MCW8313092.1 hypothetical protein [Sphingobacterium sp. InxBP1]